MLAEKPIYTKTIYVGSSVKLVGGTRVYEVTDMWIDRNMVTWLRLDNQYVYAYYAVRPYYD